MKKHLERLMLLACLLMSMGLAHGQTLPVLNMGYVHECVVFQSCSCLGSSGVRGNISSPVRRGKPVLSVVEGIKMEVGFEATTITPSLTLPHRGGENRMAA